MHFLTFDTSLDKTYLTLFEGENALSTQIIETHDDKYHSAYLIQNLVDILKSHALTMKDIKAIGVNVGPGSFTGIRACLTIARVIAQQLEIPLIGVSSLEILSSINEKGSTTIVMDARKGMCYYAHYNEQGEELTAPHLVKLEELTFNEKTTIISDKVMQEFLKEKNIKSICYTEENRNLGEYLGRITYKKLQTEENHHWASVKPLYLQKPSITISKKVLV